MKSKSSILIRNYIANNLQLEHSLKGRIRMRFTRPGKLTAQILKSYEAQVIAELSSIKAVSAVEINVVSGSILVLYDPAVIDTPGQLYILVCDKLADLTSSALERINHQKRSR